MSKITISINGVSKHFENPTTINAVFKEMLSANDYANVLAALFNGNSVELYTKIEEDATLIPIYFDSDEGSRIYERSLCFLTLAALNNLYPTKQFEVEDAVGKSIAFNIKDKALTHAEIYEIEKEMWRLVENCLPITRHSWTVDEAIKFFTQDGQLDKVDLYSYRKTPKITMYCLDGIYDYFYGSMLQNTSYIKAFKLTSKYPGMLVSFPKNSNMKIEVSHSGHKKQYRVFAESQRWCEILNATNVVDVNRMIETGRILDFIRVNEALHDSSIANIASEALQKKARIVLIFGPSCSGKTTFTNRLAVHLKVHGLSPALVSLDNFYKDRETLPIDENGEVDLETIDALDIDFIVDCFDRLLAGEEVSMPKFSFKTGKRKPNSYKLKLTPDQPILVEGIHAMNDKITSMLPEQLTYGIYVSALSCLKLDDHNRIHTSDARLLRRIVRDMQFRGTPPEDTINMWKSVRAGEEKWIYPNQEKADIMFNTTLHYELPLLHSFIYDKLEKIDVNERTYIPARRLVKSLNYFLPIGDDFIREIPPLSIIREFIGGSTFYTGRD